MNLKQLTEERHRAEAYGMYEIVKVADEAIGRQMVEESKSVAEKRAAAGKSAVPQNRQAPQRRTAAPAEEAPDPHVGGGAAPAEDEPKDVSGSGGITLPKPDQNG